MSGPWEDFASTQVATASNSGPWEDFAATGTSKPWEDFGSNAQKLSNTGAQPQPSLLNRGLSKVGQGLQYVEGKMQPLLSPLLDIFREDPGEGSIPPSARRFAEATETYGPPTFGAVVPGIAAGIVPINTQVPGHEMRPPPSDVPLPTAMVAPGRMLKAGAEMVNPLNTALAIGTMGAGELAPAVAKALGIVFGTQIAAESLPQQLGQTSVEPTPENISDAAIQALMLGGIAHEVAPGKQQPMLAPGANGYVSGEMTQGTSEMPFLAKNRPAIQLEDRPQFQERPPLIGQRPLTIEQQIVPPTQVNPGVIQAPELASKPIEQPSAGQVSFAGQQGVPSAMQSKGMVEGRPATYGGERTIKLGSEIDLSGDFERYKEVQNLMKVAMAKGDQEGLMKAFAEMEQIKNRQPIRGMPPVEPAKPAPAATKASLRPAVEVNGKLLVGDVGDTHADILTRNGIDPELYKHADPARGFTTDGKTLISREDAAKIAGEEGTAKAGGLDSQDLVQASKSPRQRYLENIAKMSDEEFAQEWKNQSKGVENKAVRASLISGDTVYVGGTVHAETVMMAREAKLPVNLIRHEGRTWMAGDGRTILDESQKPIANQPKRIVWLDKVLAKEQLAKEFPNITRSSGDSTYLYSGIPIDKSGKLKDSLKTYWMHFAGHLLPETEDYKLAREVIHDDLTPAKGNLPDEQAKSLEQEMQAKGFTKIIDDGKNIYVDNNASTTQLAGMKNKAKAEGKELVRMNLYSGTGLEEGDLGKFAMTASRLLRSPSRLKFNIGEGEAIDSGQLVNRLMNSVPPAEKAYLEGLGIREEFPAGKKATAKEVDEWIGEREPKVEVKTSTLQKGATSTEHEAQHWLETRGYEIRGEAGELVIYKNGRRIPNYEMSPEVARQFAMFVTGNFEGKPEQTTHWQSIAPKTEKEMPGYVEGAVTLAPSKAKDFEDYRLARGMFNGPEVRKSYERDVQLGRATGQTLFPSSHSFPPNTLGLFRGYMEERPDGGKTFHVIEVQSDWADRIKRYNKSLTDYEQRHDQPPKFESGVPSHPLLRDWERLTLKAAIDHARKEGADRIAVSDAETAMMTQGHDRQGERIIPQESGMRLHYDKILPKLLRELTGEEGKRVEFGTHRMAVGPREALNLDERGQPRKDLIFRNLDNTPKTSISATEFPLSKVSAARSTAPFTTFRKDKPHNLYSGINPFDTDSLTTILDRFFGHGVDRTFDEGLKHLEAKYHGYSAPHHVAASEDLANKLVRFAAADVYSQVKGLSHEETVAMRDQTFQRLIEAGIRDGVYKYGKAGEASTIDGQPTKAFDVRAKGIGHKSLRVRADLAPEFEMATTRKGKIVKEGAQMMLDLLTEAQIIGPTDFVFHTGNMYASVVKSPGKSSNYLADLALRMPVAKHLDAIGRIGYEFYRDITNDPAIQVEMERMAKIGALRGRSEHTSLVGKTPIIGEYIDTGKWIQKFDAAGRRARNRMFDNLVKQKLVEDTELDRREFINKMGQYNDKLMSQIQAVAKNYSSQFIVAGRTFNRNAMQSILASKEFRTANPIASAKARFSNIAALLASATVLPVVLNAVLTGKPFGRAGTPIGKIDTGKDDANGRPIVIDPMQTDLSRRGFRNLGGEAVVEGLREGREPLDITERAIWAIAMGQLHPWEGPPVRFLEAGIGKKKAGGTAGEAIMEALKAINPTITAALSKTEEGKPGGIGAVAQQLGGAIGVGKGRILSHVERVEKTVDKSITDLSLEDRILAEQRTKSERQPITEEQSTKAAVRAIESEGKRGEALKASFDKLTKQWLDSRQLTVPGYDNKLDFGKTRLYLNPTEEKRLDSLVKEEYQRTIEAFKTDKDAKDFDSLPSLRRQEVFHAAMTQAAKRAHGRMKEELDTKHPSSSNAQNMGKTGRKKRKYHVFGE